jgi:hypothetical protein
VDLCADLGYRASDLLQANSIVWVEGPTDRLYIRHWLSAVADELVEGIHYSVMFYGGRLLAHLAADDIEVEDFISLRRINQWLSIVIDSDRRKKGAKLNATKRRVRDEFDQGPGYAWITQGREIENYVPADLLWDAIQKAHPGADSFAESPVHINRRSRPIDKLKVAHHVITEPADLTVLDLKKQVERLAAFISSANGA